MFGLFKRKPKYTYHEMGYIIAGGLLLACTKQQFSKQQIELMEGAEIPLDIFWQDVICLAAFSAEYALFHHLNGTPAVEPICNGFWQGWESFTAQNAENKRVFDIIRSRLNTYAIALASLSKQGQCVLGDPVGVAFSDFLSHSVHIDLHTVPRIETESDRKTNARRTDLLLLSALTVPVITEVYFKLSTDALLDYGVLRQK